MTTLSFLTCIWVLILCFLGLVLFYMYCYSHIIVVIICTHNTQINKHGVIATMVEIMTSSHRFVTGSGSTGTLHYDTNTT